ncbi:aldehyde dehydrogenase [Grosmannia clavigera kw1407]|uniref:Aldehyde dehydrogenase n=1 Tax=Grosmannia clavigera (strain kw1407 / UAMH 11150) TaxID=655863 RepID=F0XNL8_GROCL|nr:aldehyde dehydrogenase [Grosmannia clavigera kw1407]EFX00184.1 aldehyde dehydrogenase [Grosmannia clavigera kw1407]
MAISEEAKSLAAFEPSAFGAIHAELQATFSSGKTKAIAWRKWQLKQFWWMVEDNEQAILDALAADLGRHEMEGRAADLLGLKSDILEHLGHVDEWAATTRVADAGLLFGGLGRARLRKEPVGVVLVIGAWNFPFLLTLQPVIAAIAAGCCVVMKPSELAPASERVMADLVHRYLDRSAVRLVRGGPEETTAVLQRRFDHIFFTGSSTIARFVTAAAARHLTPTTLELGGQCPAIVAQTADVDLAARRIAYAKFLNAGQICLSVNHVLVHPAVHHAFLARLEHWTRTFAASGHMCRIISDRHYDRLARILDSTQGTVIRTAESSREERRLASAIVSNVTMSDPVMSEELFGPICPVLKTDTVDAIAAVNSLPRPLGLYIFSADKAEIETIQNQTLSGGRPSTMPLCTPDVQGLPLAVLGNLEWAITMASTAFWPLHTYVPWLSCLPIWTGSCRFVIRPTTHATRAMLP